MGRSKVNTICQRCGKDILIGDECKVLPEKYYSAIDGKYFSHKLCKECMKED